MFKIAITGGIGSGKSTVANILKAFGYKCFSADEIYNNLLKKESFVVELSKFMGVSPIIIDSRAVLDKKAISELVFADKNELKKLNGYTHPIIMKVLSDGMSRLSDERLIFAEVPLLFEEGYDKLFDYIFVINRDFGARLTDTMSRDGKSEEEVKRVINAQFDYRKLPNSDKIIVINNNGSLDELKRRLNEIISAINKI